MSHREAEDSPWGAPQNLGSNINTAGDDLAPFVTDDNHTLYFARDGACGGKDIFVARRIHTHDDEGWGPAQNLGCTVNSAKADADPMLVESGEDVGTLYLVSDRLSGSNFDIFSSARIPGNKGHDGVDGFAAPALVTELSSPRVEFKTAISHDGLEMFIGSNRTGSAGNDIWVSTRAKVNEPWGTPVNVGSPVNSAGADAPGSLSADGTTLYFQSNKPGGFGMGDIYKTTRSLIAK